MAALPGLALDAAPQGVEVWEAPLVGVFPCHDLVADRSMTSGGMRRSDLVEKNTLTLGVTSEAVFCSTTPAMRPDSSRTSEPTG